MEIYKFHPYLKPVIWGGDKIAKRKSIAADSSHIGESWEISDLDGSVSVVSEGADKGLSLRQLIEKYKDSLVGSKTYHKFGGRFPLLIKFIDARENLSVQVHPDDRLAAERHGTLGKSEMWYVLETEPDATIYTGLKERLDSESFVKLVEEDRIMDAVAAYESHEGDIFFLPGGRVHAIGAGNLLAEIQESSDVTYRIYDYGRRDFNGNPRELHTALAKEAIDYTVMPDYRGYYDDRSGEAVPLVKCQHFGVSKLTIDRACDMAVDGSSFVILICLKGDCAVSLVDSETDETILPTVKIPGFSTALVPAVKGTLRFSGSATMLLATV